MEKEEKPTLQESTFNMGVVRLLDTHVQEHTLPLGVIEVVLDCIPLIQILKFPIDGLSGQWTDKQQPIFSYLDLSYAFNGVDGDSYQSVLVAAIIFMNAYWLFHIITFAADFEWGRVSSNARKLFYLITKNLLFLPLLNLIVGLGPCSQRPLRYCPSDISMINTAASVFSFALFATFLGGQTFFAFDFMPLRGQFRRLRRSAYLSTFLLGYLIVNESASLYLGRVQGLLILDLTALVLVLLGTLRSEEVSAGAWRVVTGLLGVNSIAVLMANVLQFTSQNLTLPLLAALSLALVLGLAQLEPHSMEFELNNINRWPTAQIMTRYTSTLRHYLNHRHLMPLRLEILGYMEVHRQRCDNQTCPSRAALTPKEQSILKDGPLNPEDEQILRCQSIVRQIFKEGQKITPLNAQLQLEKAIFTYEMGQKQNSLKELLLVRFKQLSWDRCYRYLQLRSLLHSQLVEQPGRRFLDLVSQLRVKAEEERFLACLENVAMANLEFWSTLNEDHPDFMKLNQNSLTRVRTKQQVKCSFEAICRQTHSQRVISLYVQYLEAIQNDEALYNDIMDLVQTKYQLADKILLQDWAGTSRAILLVSIEENNSGMIIDVNSAGSALFGYERYELLNRQLKMLFHEQLRDEMPAFLGQGDRDEFFLSHRSGYAIRVKRQAQNYNSLETGMAAIISITQLLTPHNCFLLASQEERMVGGSSSMIPLTGLTTKHFQHQMQVTQLFKMSLSALNSQCCQLHELINEQFESDITDCYHNVFQVEASRQGSYWVIKMLLVQSEAPQRQEKEASTFEFQVQATVNSMKYFGSYESHDTYLSQFSQLYYAESIKKVKTARDYANGISTLRLKNNIIMVIEENEEEQVDGLMRRHDEDDEIEDIPRKDQEVIFDSRVAFEKFIQEYGIARWGGLVVVIGLLLLVLMYLAYYLTYTGHIVKAGDSMRQMTYQVMICGASTKEIALAEGLRLMSAGLSNDTASRFVTSYMDNLNYLDSIKLKGIESQQLTVTQGGSSQIYVTDQFVLSLHTNGLRLVQHITANMTNTQLGAAYNATPAAIVNFLVETAFPVVEAMMSLLSQEEANIVDMVGGWMNSQIIMMVGGLLAVAGFGTALLLITHRINQQRLKVLEIFLGVNQIQIQAFSSKTEKFLLSLHVQDSGGQIDVEEEVENSRKVNSSTFAKKKRFKQIAFEKGAYLRLLVLPVLAFGFFLHSFLVSYLSLSLEYNSVPYFFLSSKGDYVFQGGLRGLQRSYMNFTMPTSLSQEYVKYYDDYFGLHYNTYGEMDDFHEAYTFIYMMDICQGHASSFGSTRIPEACQLPLLAPNGTNVVFSDLVMNTEFFRGLAYRDLVEYEVLSKTHRFITQALIKTQQDQIEKTNHSLLVCLLAWGLSFIFCALLYGLPAIQSFILGVNQLKNILTILPISMARELPRATRYFNTILQASQTCPSNK